MYKVYSSLLEGFIAEGFENEDEAQGFINRYHDRIEARQMRIIQMSPSKFFYGMKRYFDLGCQPSGQIDVINERERLDGYKNIVVYNRRLTTEDIYKYELQYLGENINV